MADEATHVHGRDAGASNELAQNKPEPPHARGPGSEKPPAAVQHTADELDVLGGVHQVVELEAHELQLAPQGVALQLSTRLPERHTRHVEATSSVGHSLNDTYPK